MWSTINYYDNNEVKGILSWQVVGHVWGIHFGPWTF